MFRKSERPVPLPLKGNGSAKVKMVPSGLTRIAESGRFRTSLCENGEKKIFPPEIGSSFVSSPADSKVAPEGTGRESVREVPLAGSVDVIWNAKASWQVPTLVLVSASEQNSWEAMLMPSVVWVP